MYKNSNGADNRLYEPGPVLIFYDRAFWEDSDYKLCNGLSAVDVNFMLSKCGLYWAFMRGRALSSLELRTLSSANKSSYIHALPASMYSAFTSARKMIN